MATYHEYIHRAIYTRYSDISECFFPDGGSLLKWNSELSIRIMPDNEDTTTRIEIYSLSKDLLSLFTIEIYDDLYEVFRYLDQEIKQ